MLALYRSGRQADALESFQEARGVLEEQLGLEPGPELRRLQEAILTHDPAIAPITAAPRRGNLPTPSTSFVDRDQELARVVELLHEHRLVTLTGPPGVGKSRLALEVGRSLEPEIADGIWLVDLGRAVGAADVARPRRTRRRCSRCGPPGARHRPIPRCGRAVGAGRVPTRRRRGFADRLDRSLGMSRCPCAGDEPGASSRSRRGSSPRRAARGAGCSIRRERRRARASAVPRARTRGASGIRPEPLTGRPSPPRSHVGWTGCHSRSSLSPHG